MSWKRRWIYHICDREEYELVAVIARKIWFMRNTVALGSEFTYPDQVIREPIDSIAEYMKANANEGEQVIYNMEEEQWRYHRELKR
jgi:hypothetical protein